MNRVHRKKFWNFVSSVTNGSVGKWDNMANKIKVGGGNEAISLAGEKREQMLLENSSNDSSHRTLNPNARRTNNDHHDAHAHQG